MSTRRSIARPLAIPASDFAVSRRGLLMLLGAGAALAWSARMALGQTEVDQNGNPIRLPGQTPTPNTRAREREAVDQQRNRVLQDRAQQRSNQGQQQFQNDRSSAQQRELNVQRNFDAQQRDILNNRDKP
jgi:hypothetical protein